MSKQLFIVTGAAGELGTLFIEKLIKRREHVIGISRSEFSVSGVEIYKADLTDEVQIREALKNIHLETFQTINLIHPVGKFKFEKNHTEVQDDDKDGIDDEVYKTNVITLKNVIKDLMMGVNKTQKINVCAFASISDKHSIPFWKSYTKSKNIIRGYLKELCEQNYIHALMVNVSTVDTGNENLLRPNADKTYWLQPQEIVFETLPELVNISRYKEIDLYKEKPDFNKDYYLDHEAILKKWEKEMKNKE